MSGAGADARTLAPPERRIAEVRSSERLGAYDLITVRDVAGPAEPAPGQFYMLAAAERWGGGVSERPYLPRAFSFARAKPDPAGGVRLQFLLEDIGPGTHRLAELSAGEGLALLGPLGRGFEAPADGRTPVLAGGGIGTAPLLCWEDELRAGGAAPAVVLGFRGAGHAEAASLFAPGAAIATDDGSVGHHGLVTDPLRDLLEADSHRVVYACGPPAMLAAVRDLCAELGVPAQLALESGMACGFGACFGCVVETVDGYERVCVDGPVFEGERLVGVGHA